MSPFVEVSSVAVHLLTDQDTLQPRQDYSSEAISMSLCSRKSYNTLIDAVFGFSKSDFDRIVRHTT